MIGELFTINATNIGRAGIREAERHLAIDAPNRNHTSSRAEIGDRELYIEVRGADSKTREITGLTRSHTT